MRILRDNKELSDLASKVSGYISIDDLLKGHKIPCLAQSLGEVNYSEDRKMFEFGYRHWGKRVISFYDDEYIYYAIGSFKDILRILEGKYKEIFGGD
jgi:hypothetical protein